MSDDQQTQDETIIDRAGLDKHPSFIRLLLIVLFMVVYSILTYAVYLLAAWQAISNIAGGGPNENLIRAGSTLRTYLCQILDYVIFTSHERPFPFAKWPSVDDVLDKSSD